MEKITKTNHFIPRLIAKHWFIQDPKIENNICYYHDQYDDVFITSQDKLIAGQKIYLQDSEDWFDKTIESGFASSFNEAKRKNDFSIFVEDFETVKRAALLLFTMSIRNPFLPGFDKNTLDKDLKNKDWNAMASIILKQYSIFLLRSPKLLCLNTYGLIPLPPITKTGFSITDRDRPLGMAIDLNTMLCFSKKVSDEHLETYYEEVKDKLTTYSMGLFGKVIIPVDRQTLGSAINISSQYKKELLSFISEQRSLIFDSIQISRLENLIFQTVGLE